MKPATPPRSAAPSIRTGETTPGIARPRRTADISVVAGRKLTLSPGIGDGASRGTCAGGARALSLVLVLGGCSRTVRTRVHQQHRGPERRPGAAGLRGGRPHTGGDASGAP